MPLLPGTAVSTPWWWARISLLEKRLQGIKEAAGVDPEQMVAPKELWVLSQAEELERWFEERRKIERQPQPLDDYG